jgi:hypothetical protein
MGYLERQPKRMANNRIVEWYSAALDQKTEEEQSIENYHRLAKLLDIIIQAKENMKEEMAKLKKENRRKFAYYEKNFTYEEPSYLDLAGRRSKLYKISSSNYIYIYLDPETYVRCP